MKIKIKYSLLALLIVMSTVFSALTAANPALAAGPPTTLDDTVKSYLYYKALNSCFEQGGTGNVLATDVSAGHWFRGGGIAFAKSTVMGYLGDPSDGTASCGDTNLINSAMSLWGLGSGIDAWCNVMQHAGPYRDPPGDNRDCAHGTGTDVATVGGNNRADSFKQVVEEAYYGVRGEPQLTGAAKYWLYLNTFTKLCKAEQFKISDPAPTPPLTSDEQNIPNTPKGYTVKIINDAGTAEEWIYQGKGDPDKNFITNMFDGAGRGDGTPRCSELATRIGENAAAYAQYKADHPQEKGPDLGGGAGGSTDATSTDAKTSCKIDGIGWLICPVLRFMAGVVDGAYKVVATLLTVQPLMSTGDSTQTGAYNAWSMMRNFANVAFVVVFLIIIFSQITSVGITNYGVKKMLPRLIAAAILVNISFWICAVAVDVSNILGTSVKGLFDGASKGLAIPTDGVSQWATGDPDSIWTNMVAYVIAGAAVTITILYISLSALVPALIVALLAIVTVFVVLTVRQALIILLVVISPLAFVAYLLPNTESLFKKWMDLFKTMLLMFPIIGMMFGAAGLASKIIIMSANNRSSASGIASASGEALTIAIQIMGALVAIIPLILTPIIMKAAGGVLGKVGAFVNNPNKGPFDRMKKGAEGFTKSRKDYRKLKNMNGGTVMPGRGFMINRGVKREATLNNRQRELKRASAKYIADRAAAGGSFAGALSRGGGEGARQRAVDDAVNVQATIQADEVKAANARIDRASLDLAGLRSVSLGQEGIGRNGKVDAGDNSAKHAAIQQVVQSGDVGGIRDLVDSAHKMDPETAKIFADALQSSSNRPAFMGASAISDVRQGGAKQADGTRGAMDTNDLVQKAINSGVYSPEKIAKADKDEVGLVANNLSSPNVTADAVIQVKADASTAFSDQKLGAGKNRENLDNIVGGRQGNFVNPSNPHVLR